MADFQWCHGPECHKMRTVDRVRGPKGSKVLRTRKIKQHINRSWYTPNASHNYFCGVSCQTNFWNKHAQRIIALDPRTEPLQTRIEDPVRHSGRYGTTIEYKEDVDFD
jgi:hypothetical protein